MTARSVGFKHPHAEKRLKPEESLSSTAGIWLGSGWQSETIVSASGLISKRAVRKSGRGSVEKRLKHQESLSSTADIWLVSGWQSAIVSAFGLFLCKP